MRHGCGGFALVMVLLAGCGGSEGAKAPAATPTSTALAQAAEKGEASETIPLERYLARGDAICRKGTARVRRLIAPVIERLGDRPSLDEQMQLNELMARATEPVLERMSALPLPEGKEDEARTMVKQIRTSMDQLSVAVTEFEAGNTSAWKEALARNRSEAYAYADSARALGFRECGTEFDS